MIITEFFIPIAHAAQEVAGEVATQGVAGTLGLNITYFIGQLLTFSVVLVVLWKFVFNPVAKKLTERTEKIEKSLNDATRIEKEKQEFEIWKNQEMSKARLEASTIITLAQTEAGKARQQILDQTKHDQQKLVDQAKSQIESEKNQQLQAAKSELANIITTATEKILRKKLDSKADQELIKVSLTNIK